MYNQFILEELKTLKDLLQAGAITQGEFDHLKQILIDGTKASNESTEAGTPNEKSLMGDVYENPDEVIRYYSNETKNLLLYKQFDKAYPFVQKILSLRPDHREANRFLHEIKTYIRRDYLIGGIIGVVLACVLSFILTFFAAKDVNLVLLCIIPVLAGLMLPRMISSVLIGKVSSRGMRYFIAATSVITTGCLLNLTLTNVLLSIENGIWQKRPDIVSIDTTSFYKVDEDFENELYPPEVSNITSDTSSNPIQQDAKTSTNELTSKEAGKKVTEPEMSIQTDNKAQVTIAAQEDSKVASVRTILNSYYQDLSSQKFDADKYYARKVSRFFNMQDITPQTITEEVHSNYYTDFQDAVSTIASNSLEISPVKGGLYQADFKEVIKCFRKSANKPQTITSKVKVVFDKNMKIVYYSSRPISTKEFGEKADEKNVSKMVYFQNDSQ